MKNPFKNIFSGIKTTFSRASGAIRNLFRKTPAQEKPPEIPKTKQQIRQEKRINAESQAQEQALWAIRNAIERPEDKTAQRGRRQAIEYLSRAEHLKGKGPLQDMNRQTIAERFIQSGYSTFEGQQILKEKKLEIFNQNFGMDLTQGEAKKVSEIMETTSFKKLLEKNREMYDVVISSIGNAVENQVDPVRVEGTLSILERIDTVPEYDDFTKIMQLSDEQYNFFSMQAEEIAGRKVMFDQDYDKRRNDFADLLDFIINGDKETLDKVLRGEIDYDSI